MEHAEFKPPYMSFQTFWSFIEELAGKPLPPRIDRSLMGSKSGPDQANLAMALTSFGLTGDDGRVLPALADLVATEPEQRRVKFGDLVRQHYASALEVSAQNGTEADLKRSFSEAWPSIGSSDTRRKAITFFLHAARAAGMPLSAHFPSTRTGSGAPGTPRARRTTPKRKSTTTTGGDTPLGTSPQTPVVGHAQSVRLRSGGTVTLGYDVSLFSLDDADQEFVLGLIGMVKSYLASASSNADGSSAHTGHATTKDE